MAFDVLRFFRKPPERPDPSEIGPTEEYVAYRVDPDIALQEDGVRLLITVLGSTSAGIEATIRSACSVAIADGRFPIVVCTDVSTSFLVQAQTPIELLPRAQDLSGLNRAEYAYYLEQRWKILLGKWNIAEMINLSSKFEDFLEAQLDLLEP